MEPRQSPIINLAQGVSRLNSYEKYFQNCLSLLPVLNPQIKVIHVVGSNGKGSTAYKTAKGLEFSGYKVGLFISPHLMSENERIMINEEPISTQELNRLKVRFGHITPFFVRYLVMAIEYFNEQGVDLVVLEAGLGARLDPTRHYEPILSFITSFSKEHTDLLGPTLLHVATNKCHTIRKNRPTVIAQSANLPHTIAFALREQAELISVTADEADFNLNNTRLVNVGLKRISQDMWIDPRVYQMTEHFKMKGRFDTRFLPCILDVAHNEEGFIALKRQLEYHFPNQKFKALFALKKSKDRHALKTIFSDIIEEMILPKIDNLMDPNELKEELQSLGFQNIRIIEILEVEIKRAIKEKWPLLIFGSFYLLGPSLQIVERLNLEPSLQYLHRLSRV